MNKKLLILASGEADSKHGGSGFKNLTILERRLFLRAEIVGVASNHPNGGVHTKADNLGVPFFHLPNNECKPEGYQDLVQRTGAEFVALSGWLRPVRGLNPCTTFNIHPAPLPMIGGKGCHGVRAHAAALEAYRAGRIHCSGVSMHFVTDYNEATGDGYDSGPVFFQYPVEIMEDDIPLTLQARVNAAEHICQPIITQLVLDGHIWWDGKNPRSLVTPFPID